MHETGRTFVTADYAHIFDARGRLYHEAMRGWPDARDEEFQNAIQLADVRPGERVADYPSGGGYLRPYLDATVQLVLLETSRVFLDCASADDGSRGSTERWFVEHGRIPLPDGCLDCALSIAGLHHVADKRQIFRELHRCLKPSGRLVIADVAAGSAVARFLDEFVDRYSHEGHAGLYFDDGTAGDLVECGYYVWSDERRRYAWRFPSRDAMAEYCQKLFGLVLTAPDQIIEALGDYLGFVEQADACALHWELQFLAARRTA